MSRSHLHGSKPALNPDLPLEALLTWIGGYQSTLNGTGCSQDIGRAAKIG